jgi:hypothetical protein
MRDNVPACDHDETLARAGPVDEERIKALERLSRAAHLRPPWPRPRPT